MGNSRRFRAGRQAKTQSLKAQLKAIDRENSYYRGYAASLEAQLAATNMERPADLDEWIDSVALPDMDPEERQAWEAMSEPERDRFKDELGQQINATKLMAARGQTPS